MQRAVDLVVPFSGPQRTTRDYNTMGFRCLLPLTSNGFAQYRAHCQSTRNWRTLWLDFGPRNETIAWSQKRDHHERWYRKPGPFSGPKAGATNFADLRPKICVPCDFFAIFVAPAFCRDVGLLVRLGPKSDLKMVPFSGPWRHCRSYVASQCKSCPLSGPISGTTLAPRTATPI